MRTCGASFPRRGSHRARAWRGVACDKRARSPFVHLTSGRRFSVRFASKVIYEIDGGDRKKTKRLKVKVDPGAITVCVPDIPAA